MTNEKLKLALNEAGKLFVRTRIENLEISLRAAQESGNDETKSTTGDKHETGKAMMQLEQEKIGIQLNELQKMSKVMEGIPTELSTEKIKPGNVIMTSQGNFYISIAAGKLTVDNELYFAISAVSPLGVQFMKAAPKAEVTLQGKVYRILDTF
ncbi:MAG: 3-oxoacyl-ACP synthase [Bacteroidota bacterium]|nr:3-oxoacyl-ACP synthase [Bacteroidota bacterium]